MANKKINSLLEERRAKDRANKGKTDGTASAESFLSDQIKGTHKDGYKETTIKLRITEQEKELWKQQAKGKPLSAFIRDNVNYNISKGVTADDLLQKKGGK